jgi:EmrB/QacA subfamily drug resistance transporter
VLIGARVIQGLGAAMMNPATLSIITVTFPPHQRGRAIGIWAGVSALALAIGPLVGGILSERANWNWIFFINIPVGVLAVIAAYLFINESRDTSREQRPDFPGLITSTVGLFALSYALIEANNYGWGSTRIVAAFAIATVSLVAFVLLELHQRLPMLDMALFKNRTFAGANTVMLLVGLAMFGMFFFVSLYVQNVLGYSPIQAGASFLPWTLLIVAMAPQAGHLNDRVGPRWLVTGGMIGIASALFVFSRYGEGATFWDLLPAMILGGIGMSAVMPPVTATAMGAVPRDKAGVGSAVLNSMRQIGGSIGLALLGAIVAQSVPSTGRPAPSNYVAGYHHALEVGTVIALSGALIAALTLRKVRGPEPAKAPSTAIEAA